MKKLILVAVVFVSTNVFANTAKELESFNKVKNVYVSHLQNKIIALSEMTSCMSQGKAFEDLKACSKAGKAKIAVLDKKAHAAHLKAKKKKVKSN